VRPGLNSQAKSEQKDLKLVLTAFLLDSSLKKYWENRPASRLVVSLGKALNGIASTFEWL